jgi:two-component system, chemotaxis family, chemotaxis protein CheY
MSQAGTSRPSTVSAEPGPSGPSAVPADADHQAPSLAGGPDPDQAANLRVLLVEDNTPLRSSLRELLEDEGFDVVGEADDGEQGVQAAGQLSPDVVVMDLKMPKMDGIEATRQIRTVAPDARVLIMSAYLDDTLERWAREAGAFAFVGKAASFDRLHRLLMQATGRDDSVANPLRAPELDTGA